MTGGAGFLGSHLCSRLINDGAYVICLDNFTTGRKSNIIPFLGHPHFKLLEFDVIQPFPDPIDVDEIYHLACPASPVHYQNDPIKTMKTSVFGALNMLDLANKNNAKILLASTSEVYGDPNVCPQSESYLGSVNTIGPRACYDEGKRCAETLFFDYHRKYGVKIKIIRIFNTYGPNMDIDDGRVISNFIVQALRGKNITIYGDGSQTRSFCYVDDLIEGIIKMMDSKEHICGPVNLGNPENITIHELAKKIIDMTGTSEKLSFLSLPEDDPCNRKPDIALAQQEINWSPIISLDQGLEKTIRYFKKALL